MAFVVAVLARTAVIRAGLELAGWAAGYHVRFGEYHIGSDGAEFHDLRVVRGRDPLLEADRLDFKYHVSDITSRSGYRYGVSRIYLGRPHFHIITHKDGSSNLPLAVPQAGAPAKASAPTVNVGFSLTASVRDGSVEIVDDTRIDPQARVHRLERINLEMTAIAGESLHYRLTADLHEEGGVYPIRGAARIELKRGFAIHHFTAARLPLRALGNYAINSVAARIEGGYLSGVDARLYAIAGAANPAMIYHISAHARLHEGAIRINPLLAPVRGLEGDIDVHDNGVATKAMTGSVLAVPLRLSGGIYNFSNPQFRIALDLHGELATLRQLFSFSRTQALRGPLTVAALIEGGASDPVVLMNVAAQRAYYQMYPLDGARGRVAYYNSAVTLFPLRASYGGLALRVDGSVDLAGANVRSDFAAALAGPSARIPYAAQLAPTPRIGGTLVAWGTDLRLGTQGFLSGSGGGGSARAFFAIDPDGRARYGPIDLRGNDGSSLTAMLFYDRRRDAAGLWLAAHHYSVRAGTALAALPHLQLPPIPPLDGPIDGTLAGAGPAAHIAFAGSLRAGPGHLAGVAYGGASAQIAGTFDDLHYGNLEAHGPWGAFRGAGGMRGDLIAARGIYTGSFEQLRTFTGDLGAHGALNGPLDVVGKNGNFIVQTSGVALHGASIRNVPLDAIAGTIGIEGANLHVYTALASLAGGAAVAAGDLASGVSLSASGIHASRLSAAGIPLTAGQFSAVGDARTSLAGPAFEGALAVRGGYYGKLRLWASAAVQLAGTTLGVRDGMLVMGHSHADAQGTIDALGSAAQRYNLDATVRGADVPAVSRAVGLPNFGIAADADGDFHISGAGAQPHVSGAIRVPVGTINGLYFNDLHSAVAADARGVFASAGVVSVGATHLAFSASNAGDRQQVHVQTSDANLADFDNYFDPGDLLEGRGRIKFALSRGGSGHQPTTGNVAFSGLRIAQFRFGDAAATWASRAGVVSGNMHAGGATGTFEAHGSIAPDFSGADIIRRSRYHVTLALHALDLGSWLPTIGYESVPLSGKVDGTAQVDGRYPALRIATDATLVGGNFGKIPIQRLAISATSTLRQTSIAKADIELPDVSASASGSIGPDERLMLTAHARSPQIATIAGRVLGRPVDAAGSLEVDVRVGGTIKKPGITGGFDLENARYGSFAIARAIGALAVDGRDLALQDVEIGLAHGSVQIAGKLPLQINPAGIGPGSAPLELDLATRGVDLADFVTLFPSGTHLGGKVDGRIGLSGTPDAPIINGGLALTNGLYSSPLESVPITNANASISFNGTTAQIQRFEALAGGGTLQGQGTIAYARTRPAGSLDYAFDLVANRAILNFPAYGRGQVDGTLTLHSGAPLAELAGNLTLSKALISFNSILAAASSTGATSGSAAGAALPLARLKVGLDVAGNVRVRGGPVDLGARGTIQLGGTTREPAIAGVLKSSGGTITYGDRAFRVDRGSVTFDPALGLVPRIDARASTHISTASEGPVDINLSVRGVASNPQVVLASDPPFDQQTILALLLDVPALGASIAFTGTSDPGNIGLPPGVLVARSGGGFDVGREAFNLLNAQFTRGLLSPFENAFGGALGLQDLAFTIDYGGGFGFRFTRPLGKGVNGVYSQSLSPPYRYTYGFEVRRGQALDAQLTFFQQQSATFLSNPASFAQQSNALAAQGQPVGGTYGWTFLLRYLFR